jgi:hypothetical protein
MESLDTVLDPKVTGFSTWELLIRFGINLIAIFSLVRVIYYPRHKNKDFLFTFFLFNCLNFLICFLLSATKIKVGFAFGLFAIFSIMRYRTVMVPVKEMGYFFVCVALGIINSLATVDDNYLVLLSCNAFILLLTLILDRNVNLTHENVKEIKYERIDLIHPDKRTEMIQDLVTRTGLPIHRVEIAHIDFLRDIAGVHAYYYSKENETKMAGVLDED